MNRKEAMRQTHQENALMSLGFTQSEANALRRISMTLRRWHEKECGLENGCIERDEATDRPYWVNSMTGRRYHVNDLETGAKKRLNSIIQARNARQQWIADDGKVTWPDSVSSYIQTDPRGAALYIIRPGDVPEGKEVDAYYTRGIVVY